MTRKKTIIILLSLFLILTTTLTSCVSESDYIPRVEYEKLRSNYDELKVKYEETTWQLEVVTKEKDLPPPTIPPTHFSNEDEIISWFTSFVANNEKALKESLDFAPVFQCMLVQAQAAKAGYLVSVTFYKDYTVPMAFTGYHTYFLLYSDKGTSIYRVDGGKGWGVSDIENWVLIYPK